MKPNKQQETRKRDILHALSGFVAQRPGLDFADYGDVSAYRSESRSITRDKHDFDTLLAAVSWRGIDADALLAATRAYSGRLSIKEDGKRRVVVDYCTGQYFPTEYRKAACAVLASALWDYWRTDCKTGDAIRAKAKKELGARLASRWFS